MSAENRFETFEDAYGFLSLGGNRQINRGINNTVTIEVAPEEPTDLYHPDVTLKVIYLHPGPSTDLLTQETYELCETRGVLGLRLDIIKRQIIKSSALGITKVFESIQSVYEDFRERRWKPGTDMYEERIEKNQASTIEVANLVDRFIKTTPPRELAEEDLPH